MREYLYLIAPFAGWIAAQGLKFIFDLRKDGLQAGDLIRSGGMPSSHTAFISALTFVIGVNEGWTSAAFAICFALTAIIGYDATGVRRTTGEQTRAIDELAKETGVKLRVVIHDARGHLLLEVLAGAATGMITGYVLHILL